MVNTEEFTQRLHKIMEYHDLSAAAFADKIDVGRSSISHLLSGRNKPSLDFVMKIINAFPDVELYWLLNGKGSFPRKDKKDVDPAPLKSFPPVKKPPQDLFSESEGLPVSTPSGGKGQEISRIVIFYENGTFEAFER